MYSAGFKPSSFQQHLNRTPQSPKAWNRSDTCTRPCCRLISPTQVITPELWQLHGDCRSIPTSANDLELADTDEREAVANNSASVSATNRDVGMPVR